jgi:signal transduction histidine kinase
MKLRDQLVARHYHTALRAYLGRRGSASIEVACHLGKNVSNLGVRTLRLAKLHDEIMTLELLPNCVPSGRPALIRKAGFFFAAAITPIQGVLKKGRAGQVRLSRFIATLSQRTVQLAASNLELSQEITRRKSVEKALKKSEQHYARLLKHSDRLQEQLRGLSRQILAAHEEERKKISRELHDVIAQTLTGINLRLSTLRKDAALNTKGLDRNIGRTQRLVERSVNIVHRFARELRPAVLDDLGLVPALQSFIKNFIEQTRIPTSLVVSSGMQRLDAPRRTVLFRVAQEALTNVARHAKARHAQVRIRCGSGSIQMEIQDDGIAFRVQPVMRSLSGRHLGLLGMRERLEMIGGELQVDSTSRTGTLIRATIPVGKASRGRVSKGRSRRDPKEI